MSSPLTQIADDVTALRAMLATDDETPAGLERDDIDSLLTQYLSEDLPAKSDAYAAVLREVEADIERLKAWTDDLSARRKAKVGQREAMLSRLHVAMDILGVDRIEGEASAFVLQNSTPKVDIEDADSLSAEFVDIVPATSKPNKAAIAKALKRGEDIPGATLIRGRHVRRTL